MSGAPEDPGSREGADADTPDPGVAHAGGVPASAPAPPHDTQPLQISSAEPAQPTPAEPAPGPIQGRPPAAPAWHDSDPTTPVVSSDQPGTPVAWHESSPQGWPEPAPHWYAGQPAPHPGPSPAEGKHPPPAYAPGPPPFATHSFGSPPPGQHVPQDHPSARRQHHRPGWGALIGVAAASAIVAGGLGGVAGGYLGSHGDLDLSGGSSYNAPPAQPGSTSRPKDSIAGIAAQALPSVVTIEVRGADGTGTGSGFVFDKQGHLITNNHVVADAADSSEIKVVLASGKHVTAKLVGSDTSYDIAVLKVDGSGLAPLPIGSSAAVVVGDEVVAVGAPLGLESTVTSGIVSALNRPVSPSGGTGPSFINAIQTDAAINPGNSGGPLLDMQGRVIGVNSAIAAIPGVTGQQSGSIGVGFSIPSDQMRKTAEQLIRTGKAVHPVIGVILDTEYTGEGVRIATAGPNGSAPITKNGPADKAGIRPGDVVIEFEGRPMTDPDELVVAIRAKDVGDVVTMKVRRGSREINVKMTLEGASD